MKKKTQGFAGERILELSDHHDLKSSLSALMKVIRAGYYPKAKYHAEQGQKSNYYTFIYCIKGFGQALVGEEGFTVKSGDFFFIPPDTSYQYQADKLQPWTIYWFNFKGEAADTMLGAFYHHSASYKGTLSYTEERIQLMDTIYKNLKRGYSQFILAVLDTCLLHFLTSWVFQLPTEKQQKDKHQQIVNESIEFMKKNLSRGISLQQIAQYLHISVSSYSAIFKKKTGVSPIDYFLQLKMQKACDYLAHTDILVKEIAFKLGIEDSQYFSRVFSRITGVSPNVYRKRQFKH